MVLCLNLSELEAQTQDKELSQFQETRHAAELLSQRAEQGTLYTLSLSLSLSLCLSSKSVVR